MTGGVWAPYDFLLESNATSSLFSWRQQNRFADGTCSFESVQLFMKTIANSTVDFLKPKFSTKLTNRSEVNLCVSCFVERLNEVTGSVCRTPPDHQNFSMHDYDVRNEAPLLFGSCSETDQHEKTTNQFKSSDSFEYLRLLPDTRQCSSCGRGG